MSDVTGSELLDEILRQRQVHSVFQPIVDLDTGAVVAYEALARGPVVRWSGPTSSSTPPALPVG